MPVLDRDGLTYYDSKIKAWVTNQKGVNNGIATLGNDGKVPSTQLPPINVMTGATASTAGTSGVVPAPAAGDQDKVLMGSGTWEVAPKSNEIYDSMNDFPVNGIVGIIYIDKSTNKLYRWNYGFYVELSGTEPAPIIYGFHINGNESDPSDAVTYLGDAYGKTPAHMDFTNDRFDYGGWENAFFMPRPCMLKYDGTVDYYLDPNDYTKKEDGVTASDVADTAYEGNAMMEWGQNGKKIWYLIVPDADPTSATVYIADNQVTEDFKAWSFMDKNGDYIDHFYTSIYDTTEINYRLRSISGQQPTKNQSPYENYNDINSGYDIGIWNLLTFSDHILITLLLTLITKSLQGQASIGNGFCDQWSPSYKSSGTGNALGLFYGANNNYSSLVKVFGMENFWGNNKHFMQGLILNNNNTYYYKLTASTKDGSTKSSYSNFLNAESFNGYIEGPNVNISLSSNTAVYISKYIFTKYAYFPYEYSGTASTYFCDGANFKSSGLRVGAYGGLGKFIRMGSYEYSFLGPWALDFYTENRIGSNGQSGSLSCRPLAPST